MGRLSDLCGGVCKHVVQKGFDVGSYVGESLYQRIPKQVWLVDATLRTLRVITTIGMIGTSCAPNIFLSF